MKGFRIAVIAVAIAAGSFVVQFVQRPIDAAQQNQDAGVQAPADGAPSAESAGAKSYAEHCAICHGEQREGNLPAFPPLLGIQHRMPDDKIAELIHSGKGRMPGFPSLQDGELSALLRYLTDSGSSSRTAGNAGEGDQVSGLVTGGGALFSENCAFCHGRDAMGGESGPDLTQSKLVRSDRSGDKIAAVVREGRPGNKMPAFNFSAQQIRSIVAFIRAREAAAAAHPGGRRGVAVADLQTGNVEAGKEYFEGAGGCAKCHSPSGDLAGIATRYEGLQLEERMLYPEDAKSRVTIVLASGEKISGTLAYLDEFSVALRDSRGTYHSWATSRVQYKVDSPVDAHVELFRKYSDDDIHNLMAYLQTLR